MRGNGITNVNVLGVLPGPSVVHFVYDNTVPEVRVYVNGTFQSAVGQSLNLNAAVPFKVGGYGTASAISVGWLLDEFRVYSRALDAAEISATWNQTLPIESPPITCSYLWSPQTSGVTTALRSVSTVSDMVGWTAGNASVVRRTTDGGVTWVNANPNPGTIVGDIYNIHAMDDMTAFVTTSPTATFIYKTINGGSNWTQVYTLAGGFINAIEMTSALTGYAQGDPVGGTWTILNTTDGGNTWTRMPTEPTQAGSEAGWNNSFSLVGTNIWYNTNISTVYRSTDLGLTWASSPMGGVTSTSYGSTHFNNSMLGLASGTAGISRSTDGGMTFTSIGTVPGTGNLNALEGYGNDYFWYVRGTGIFISSNGGLNFASTYTAPSGTFYDIDFNVSGCPEGWAVSSNGGIYKMSILTGVSGNNGVVPDNYSLSQNFPNPFNPVTKINFSLPRSGFVTLKVYDILGKEIATLVNGNKDAGNHSFDFDASHLSSGTYFYRVEAGDFIAVKKMMLIR